MKYGTQLAARSIPEWAYYNIDYDGLKKVIKKNTLARAIAIPSAVSSPRVETDLNPEFTAILYSQLEDEHVRVGLFVHTKLTELDSRLNTFSRRVATLTCRYSPAPRSSISFRLLERLSLLEGEILEAGVLLRKLSRFVAAQRTAFVKLLKKYTKWSGNSEMPKRFRHNFIDAIDKTQYLNPTLLNNRFDLWLAILTDLRSLVLSNNAGGPLARGNPNRLSLQNYAVPDESPSKSVSRPLVLPTLDLHNLLSRPGQSSRSSRPHVGPPGPLMTAPEFDLEFDMALSVRNNPSCAVYWVHPDNLIELQVLLSNYLTVLHNPASKRPSNERAASATSILSASLQNLSRNESYSSLASTLATRDEAAEWSRSLAVDDLGCFSTESDVSVAGIARQTHQGDVVFMLRSRSESRRASFPPAPVNATVDKALFLRLINPTQPFLLPAPSSIGRHSDVAVSFDAQTDRLNTIRGYLETRPNTKPIVHVTTRRTRYTALPNADPLSACAVLDRSVSFGKSGHWLGSADSKPAEQEKDVDAESFPYAILSVRLNQACDQPGSQSALIKLLDDSHLTYRATGFSLFTHAIWKIVQPPGMSAPNCVELLNIDIRARPGSSAKSDESITAPAQEIHLGCRRNGRFPTVPSNMSTQRTLSGRLSNSSATEDTATNSPESTVATRPDRRRPRTKTTRSSETCRSKPTTRYWSEYDHPSDLSGNEDEEDAYVIYIDPNAPGMFDMFTLDWLRRPFSRWFSRPSARDTEQGEAAEREGLLDSLTEDTLSTGDSLDRPRERRYSQAHQVHLLHPSGYSQPMSTLLDHIVSSSAAQLRSTFMIAAVCLVGSMMLATTSLVMVASGRRKLRARIDVAVLVCGMVSCLLAITGGLYGAVYIASLSRNLVMVVEDGDPESAVAVIEEDQGGSTTSRIRPGAIFRPLTRFGVVWRSLILVGLVVGTVLMNAVCLYWAFWE